MIPGLVSLETDIPEIFGFSFHDNKKFKDFFQFDENSKIKIKCYARNEIADLPASVDWKFSYIRCKDDQWVYSSQKGPINLKFSIDEKKNEFLVNWAYRKMFLRVGYFEPIGYIMTDYLVNKLEQEGKTYHDGAAARYNGKTHLFLGFGKNFKTTIVNSIVNKGGNYIAEEFFLLDREKVYATIPNRHRFDFRSSHRQLSENDLKNKKTDCSNYDTVIFLLYSKQDKITELATSEANAMVALYYNMVNSYYYNFFRAKDYFSGKKDKKPKNFFSLDKVRFFKIEFTNYKKVIDFIETL